MYFWNNIILSRFTDKTKVKKFTYIETIPIGVFIVILYTTSRYPYFNYMSHNDK